MEEKNMRELSLEEMDKISGGADSNTECAVHDWFFYSPGANGEYWQCSICGKTEYRGGNNYINPSPNPMPNPQPIPLD